MKRHLMITAVALALGGSALGLHWLHARERAQPATPAKAAATPKPLGDPVKRGVQWLIDQQQNNGGWGQGEESQRIGGQGHLKDTANVADTCMATLALLRAGQTPRQGDHQANLRRAIDFVVREVEQSDDQSLYITNTRGTRVQGKLGTYVDTFLAALLLSEVRNQMPDEAGRRRAAAALDKVMRKIEKNQKNDGTWSGDGWAPVLAQGLASKALNRAAQEGARVDEAVRERAEKYARNQVDKRTGAVSGSVAGSAGIPLYSSAATLGAMQDSAITNDGMEKDLRRKAEALPAASPQRRAAQSKLKEIEENKRDLDLARKAVADRMDDPRFMAGFGSNGGEEFLSYLSIGESLLAKGGPEWQKWDQSMTQNLNRVQNRDGSWSGHHCITGRSFCTAAALMVLTMDRAPAPLAYKVRRP